MFHMAPFACSKCGNKHNRARPNGLAQSYCGDCHAAYNRATRPAYRDLDVIQKAKSRTRAYSNVLQKRGKIEVKPCVACGAKAEKHHPDYSDPRTVIWLCKSCHRSVHVAIDAQKETHDHG